MLWRIAIQCKTTAADLGACICFEAGQGLRPRKGRNLIVSAHLQLDAPLVWCWDNLNIHLAAEPTEFAEANADWLRLYQFPTYAPEPEQLAFANPWATV